MHEEMITSSDSFSTIDLGDYYAILPSDGSVRKKYESSNIPHKPVEGGFCYNSASNPEFLTVEDIRKLIQKHVDSEFRPT